MTRFGRREVGELLVVVRGEGSYHRFPARRLARFQHHRCRIILNPKKRKVRKDLEDMQMGELCWRIGLLGGLMMIEREPGVYGLVSRKRS